MKLSIRPQSLRLPNCWPVTDQAPTSERIASASLWHWTATLPWWARRQKLTPAGGGGSLGYSVALNDNVALVGAPSSGYVSDAGIVYASGAVFVFTFDGNNWIEQQKLTAEDSEAYDYFGWSVALDDNTALIGAVTDDSGAGAAYVFTFDGSTWKQVQKLTASDGAADDYFGVSVTLDGDTALIGARRDDDNGSESGSAYVFTLEGSSWSEKQKLTAADGAEGDWFGYAVALDGFTALVSAQEDDDNGIGSGSAYVFTFDDSTWTQSRKLTPEDGAEGDVFGRSVALNGGIALIGAAYDDDNGANSGSAYVFTANGTWPEEAKLLASDGGWGDFFSNQSVALSGTTAIIGAPQHSHEGVRTGAAYIYTLSDEHLQSSILLRVIVPLMLERESVDQ
jgi:hypothetical protein